MLQVGCCFLTSAEPCLPAGEAHWASASNSFPAPPPLLHPSPPPQRGSVGASGPIGLSGPGPRKQWCNTQQTYVTNLCWQFLALKHRRWRPWEHSQRKLDCDPECAHMHSRLHKHTHTYTHTTTVNRSYIRAATTRVQKDIFHLHLVLSMFANIFWFYLFSFLRGIHDLVEPPFKKHQTDAISQIHCMSLCEMGAIKSWWNIDPS